MNKAQNRRIYDFQGWRSLYKTRPGTGATYYCGVKRFLCFINNVDPKRGKTSSKQTAQLASRYIAQTRAGKRYAFDDLAAFIQSWGNSPPLSLHTYVSALKEFLLYTCDVELDKRDSRALRGMMPKGADEAVTQDGLLTREKLRAILLHSDIRLKALVLFLVSSGIRVSEALQLSLGDVKLSPETGNTEPFAPIVTVRAEIAKEGRTYRSFLSSEAVEALREWLKVRESYMSSGIFSRAQHLRPVQTVPTAASTAGLIFPFSYVSASKSFINALKDAGLYELDTRTRRCTYHLHLLRKYFTSQLKLRVPPEIVEAWTGHRGYLGGVYNNQLEPKSYVELYHKGEPLLLILQDTTKLEAANEKLDLQSREFVKVASYNEALLAENRKLTERMGRWDAWFTKQFSKPTEQVMDELAQIGLAQQKAEREAEQDWPEFKEVSRQPRDVVTPKPKKAT